MAVRSSQERQEPSALLPPLRTEEPPCSVPGFAFKPTDEDLVVYYLRRYVSRQPLPPGLIVPADVYGAEPWNLLPDGQEEGYFFCRRNRRSANSKRPSRSAGGGSWHSFKREEEVKSAVDGHGEVTVGIKYSLAYKLREHKFFGWVMYEFELFDEQDTFQEFVLCHIKETRNGKKQGKQRTTSAGKCTCSVNKGDVAAVSCTAMPPLKKRRRDHTPEPMRSIRSVGSAVSSSKIPQRADRLTLKHQEHGKMMAPCWAQSFGTATIPPPPQEQPDQQIVTSSCKTAGAACPSMCEYSFDQESDFICCGSFQLQQQQPRISSDHAADALGVELALPPEAKQVADHIRAHGDQQQHIVPVSADSGTTEELIRHPIPITEQDDNAPWMQRRPELDEEGETIMQWTASSAVAHYFSTAPETAADANHSAEQPPEKKFSWVHLISSQSLDEELFDRIISGL